MNFNEVKSKVNQYIWYVLIGVLSLVACVFLPMIGSEAPFGWNLPTDTLGWILYVASAIIVAGVNMTMFFGFLQQAKLNVKDDKNKVKADEILLELNLKHPMKIKKPRSPKVWNAQNYGFKGVMTSIASFGSAMVFVKAAVCFDWIAFLTYFVTVVFGLVFGVISMQLAMQYWTQEYYEYAKLKEKEFELND